MQDAYSSTVSLAAVNNRTAISKSLAVSRPQPVGIAKPKSATPAPVTLLLATATDLSVDDLEGINYNSAAVRHRHLSLTKVYAASFPTYTDADSPRDYRFTLPVRLCCKI